MTANKCRILFKIEKAAFSYFNHCFLSILFYLCKIKVPWKTCMTSRKVPWKTCVVPRYLMIQAFIVVWIAIIFCLII